MNTEPTLKDIKESTADANAPRTVDGPPVLPAKPEPKTDTELTEGRVDGYTYTFPTIEPADESREHAIDRHIGASVYRISKLAEAYEKVRSTPADGDVRKVLEVECNWLYRVQGERPLIPQLPPLVAADAVVAEPVKAQVIARNGNRRGR